MKMTAILARLADALTGKAAIDRKTDEHSEWLKHNADAVRFGSSDPGAVADALTGKVRDETRPQPHIAKQRNEREKTKMPINRRCEHCDMRHDPDNPCIESRRAQAQKALGFVEEIASMQTSEEMEDGGDPDLAMATVDNLIACARQIVEEQPK